MSRGCPINVNFFYYITKSVPYLQFVQAHAKSDNKCNIGESEFGIDYEIKIDDEENEHESNSPEESNNNNCKECNINRKDCA